MKLIFSPTFIRASKRLIKKDAKLAEIVQRTLKILEKDTFNPILKTHKLKGKFEGRWACSVAYDLRIIFKIVKTENTETIYLLTIGTHDQIY